jgi:lipopolysaccharide export system protein LptA
MQTSTTLIARPDRAHRLRGGRRVVYRLAGGLLLAVGGLQPALAERADRNKPMTLESDRPCVVDLRKQTSVCSGNVVVSQGTLQLRAERLELGESADGYQVVHAIGSDSQPARFKQKRDGLDETIEGQARRIDYDGSSGVLNFDGQAVVRRLRGSTLADEIQGASIVWDSRSEQFNVKGGAATASNPSGRVRAVITPRAATTEAPAPAAPAAPAPLSSSPGLSARP